MMTIKQQIQADIQKEEDSQDVEAEIDYSDKYDAILEKLTKFMQKKVKRTHDLFRKMSMGESVKNNIQKADKSKQNL